MWIHVDPDPCQKKLNYKFLHENVSVLKVGNRSKAGNQVICKFWSISIFLDPDSDSHSQYGSGSREAK
jgi:hypothetical protein